MESFQSDEVADHPFKFLDVIREEDYDDPFNPRPPRVKTARKAPKEDDIMCNFIPMVREHLKISDPKDTNLGDDGESEYVYDIYYEHQTADVGELSNVGALTWDDQVFLNDEDSDSDEYDDDEDSNAEDYWANDYPDEDFWQEEASESEYSDY
ncbi:hypothetical protein HK102_004484 [Quaeritorhiza haematococci]|nr:hypothetical protein HK102_004484 [Quaeritorhiza haematococci]